MTINEDLGTPDPLPTHPLIAPLTDEQQCLVDALAWPALAPGGTWPVFDYAIRILRGKGIDAEAELAGMPVAANRTNPMMGYRHVWAEGGGNALRNDKQVQVTVAGLLTESSGQGAPLAAYVVRIIRELARLESEIVPDPKQVATASFDFGPIAASVQGAERYGTNLFLVQSILDREPPTWNTVRKSGSTDQTAWIADLNRDLTGFLWVSDPYDYLERILDYLGSRIPPATTTSPITPPLELISELGYLDAVWQTRFGEGPLFGTVRIPSSAALAIDCASADEFNARLNALYDVLSQIKVTLEPDDEREASSGQEKSLARLKRKLRASLDEELRPEPVEAVSILQAAVRIRSSLHTGVDKELQRLYERMGLRYPPVDVSTAWDQIRGRCSTAIRTIRLAVETQQ